MRQVYVQYFKILSKFFEFIDTLTCMVLKSESETPLPLASTMTGASPLRTTVTKNAVLTEPRAGTVTRSRRNNSISVEDVHKISSICLMLDPHPRYKQI